MRDNVRSELAQLSITELMAGASVYSNTVVSGIAIVQQLCMDDLRVSDVVITRYTRF